MQGELALFVDDGVPGVAAALIAHHHVILLGEVVHHAALPATHFTGRQNGIRVWLKSI